MEPHVPDILRVIQLVVAPVFLLTAGAFLGAFVATDLSRTIAILFVLAMVALIVSLLLFLREIFLAVSTTRHV